jgi:hypothetical protein
MGTSLQLHLAGARRLERCCIVSLSLMNRHNQIYEKRILKNAKNDKIANVVSSDD